MYPYFAYSATSGRRQRQYQPTQFQSQPFNNVSFESFAPSSRPTHFAPSYLDDDTDEEEQLLRAALERKKQERQARQQYRGQLELEQQRQQYRRQLELEQQRQYQALLLRERRYQQEQQAIARAKYEEQEAIRLYKRELRAQELKRQQDAFEAHVLQNLRQVELQQRKAAIARASQAHAQPRQLIAFVQEKSSSDEEDEDEDEALGALFQHLLAPLAKRTLVQEQAYPCKRRQQCIERKHEEKRAEAVVEKEKEAKKQDQTQASSRKSQDQGVAYIDLSTLLEAVFGVSAQTSSPSTSGCNEPDASTSGCKPESKATACAARQGACFAKAAPSSSESSPELRASDILRQRQQRQQQQNQTLQQKHSELNLIESSLDELSRELNHSLSIYEETDEVKRQVVLATEENVTKIMFKIDSVESDGDLSVRQRRKELIKKSQDLLETVDGYKKKESNTGKQVTKDVTEASSAPSESPASEVETRESTVESVVTAESVIDIDTEEVESETEDEDIQPYVVSQPEEGEVAKEEIHVSVTEEEVATEEQDQAPVEESAPKAKTTESTDDDDMVVV
ncbi:hypothetical protein CPC16_002781 [Podila verticillata]|nr:hypothetical protein CPC16_002781 [Podila verticillata]